MHDMNCQRKLKKSIFLKAAVCAIVAFSILWIANDEVKLNPVYIPTYERVSLDNIFEETKTTGNFGDKKKESYNIVLTENEYELIFKQTGLGRSAVDYIIKNKKDYKKEIEKFQKIFFDGYPYTCAKIGVLTHNERMRDKNGKKIKGNELVDLRPGDVLVNLSAYTLGFRHGHCGIVVDKPKKGKEAKTIEAIYVGSPTKYQTTGKWRSCPTFIHLRISKEAAESKGYTQEELGRLFAAYTKEKCLDVSYGLFPGISNNNYGNIRKTHCSHLIWYVYNQFGYDVDSDGGIIVTPADIAASDLFEIVQVYGINPDF